MNDTTISKQQIKLSMDRDTGHFSIPMPFHPFHKHRAGGRQRVQEGHNSHLATKAKTGTDNGHFFVIDSLPRHILRVILCPQPILHLPNSGYNLIKYLKVPSQTGIVCRRRKKKTAMSSSTREEWNFERLEKFFGI